MALLVRLSGAFVYGWPPWQFESEALICELA